MECVGLRGFSPGSVARGLAEGGGLPLPGECGVELLPITYYLCTISKLV